MAKQGPGDRAADRTTAVWSTREFKRRLYSRTSLWIESDLDSDGFAEMVEDSGLTWERTLAIGQELADELRRRAGR
jgi:hypothetical protein